MSWIGQLILWPCFLIGCAVFFDVVIAFLTMCEGSSFLRGMRHPFEAVKTDGWRQEVNIRQRLAEAEDAEWADCLAQAREELEDWS